MTNPPANASPEQDAWPLASSLIVSLAVAATIGLADVVHALSVAGGDIGGRLLAVLPIYFIAAFGAAQLVFWLLRAVLKPLFGLGRNAHAVLAGLTFLAAGLLHYFESAGLQRVLQEQAEAPEARRGSCPPNLACTPLPPADELREAAAAVRRTAAERGLLDAERFALLMRDPDAGVRAALARRGDLPQELLERIAGDRHPAVRAAAAGSPRLSDDLLTRLAFDREESVRLAVARNRAAPPTALEMLAASASAEIRLLVAKHPRSSEPVLQRLQEGSGDAAEVLARERLGQGIPSPGRQ